MGLKVQVRVIQARNLAAKDSNGYSDPYVRLQLGRAKAKSATVYKNLNPVWNEEFIMKIDDAENDALSIDLWDEDFMHKDDFLGQLSFPIADLVRAEGNTIAPTWYALQKKSPRSKMRVSGEVQLGISLWGRDEPISRTTSVASQTTTLDGPYQGVTSGNESSSISRTSSALTDHPSSTDESDGSVNSTVQSQRTSVRQRINTVLSGGGSGIHLPKVSSVSLKPTVAKLTSFSSSIGSVGKFNLSPKFGEAKLPEDAEIVNGTLEGGGGDGDQNVVPASWFDENLKSVPSKGEMPGPYGGGTVVDQAFGVSAHELNAIIFKQDSEFWTEWAGARKLTGLESGPWTRAAGSENEPIRRLVTYMTAPSALVKSVKATETYTYSRADVDGYVVELSVATPDVPYGGTFLTELQFCIRSIDEKNCHLVVSWRANFLQSTMMRGMIENGMRSGIKDTYVLFLQVIAKHAPFAKGASPGPNDDVSPESNWETGLEYLGQTAVIVTAIVLILLPIHFSKTTKTGGRQGLEFYGLDLPDSFLEMFYCAIIVLLGERAVERVVSFVAYRLLKRSDHGKKAQGEGWLVTCTLLEGENMPAQGLTGYCDPYITFTCNGKTRSSSVKLQTLNPHWNEILEFDAFDDAPSTMDIELFDYDGPFSTAESLGRTEINFLKRSTAELADLWIPLEGRKAKATNTRLHLRIFLTNTADGKMPKILENLEKEVGTKIVLHSAERNESFQKLFGLPENEFLISDFACAVKKKIPIQGRLFVSPRLLGFYSNLFGMKTKFCLLWEDIEEMKENAPSINAFNRLINPSITVYLRRGKGLDARAGAYGSDSGGRLKFRFLSFVRPSIAFRTITVLWRNRALPPDEQMEKVAEANAAAPDPPQSEEQAPFVSAEAPPMEEVGCLEIPVTVEQFLAIIEQPKYTDRISAQLGQLNYVATEWEAVEAEGGQKKMRREVKYVLSRQMCAFGSAVSVVQQKWKSPDGTAASIDEVITMHDVPFGDSFNVETRREIRGKSMPPKPVSEIKAWLRVTWHKESGAKDKIEHNVKEHYNKTLKRFEDVIVSEVIAAVQGGGYPANQGGPPSPTSSG